MRELNYYRNHVVRDLAWVILSPPLLRINSAHIHWPSTLWYQRNYLEYRSKLKRLDQDPAELIEALGQLKDRRLGAYFEKLIKFWLQSNKRYRLIFNNVQINQGGRTIGEFDFIVYDLHLRQYLHWEVAVKFYLGYGATQEYHAWYGPNQEDRLDRKYQHLINHQACLSETPAGLDFLSSHGIRLSGSWILIKGYLFYQNQRCYDPQSQPINANPEHLRGWWMTEDSFTTHFQHSPLHWIELPKKIWFSSLNLRQSGKKSNLTPFLKQLNLHHLSRPICIAGLEGGREIERGFLVPPQWLRHFEKIKQKISA